MPEVVYNMAESYDGEIEDNHNLAEDEDGWYENDLHLAAELGKTLLERNKELDENLNISQKENNEQAMQIVYLEKQLQILRDVTESKSNIYEQLDVSAQETEKNNQRLQHDISTMRQRIIRMNEIIDSLESKDMEQQTQIKHLKVAERDRLREGRRKQKILDSLSSAGIRFPLRRSRSHEFGISHSETLRDEEVFNLKESIKNLHKRIAEKDQQIDTMEAEMLVFLNEKTSQEERIQEMDVRHQLREIQRDYKSLDTGHNEAVCKYCDGLINADFEALIEVAGCSSTKPSNQDLHISEDSSGYVINQIMGHPKADGASLLGEIDAQYNVLMDKYNSLLVRSRSGSFRDDSMRPRAPSASDRRSGIRSRQKVDQKDLKSPAECIFENGPPHYRKLFGQIFDILRRPQAQEASPQS